MALCTHHLIVIKKSVKIDILKEYLLIKLPSPMSGAYLKTFNELKTVFKTKFTLCQLLITTRLGRDIQEVAVCVV